MNTMTSGLQWSLRGLSLSLPFPLSLSLPQLCKGPVLYCVTVLHSRQRLSSPHFYHHHPVSTARSWKMCTVIVRYLVKGVERTSAMPLHSANLFNMIVHCQLFEVLGGWVETKHWSEREVCQCVFDSSVLGVGVFDLHPLRALWLLKLLSICACACNVQIQWGLNIVSILRGKKKSNVAKVPWKSCKKVNTVTDTLRFFWMKSALQIKCIIIIIITEKKNPKKTNHKNTKYGIIILWLTLTVGLAVYQYHHLIQCSTFCSNALLQYM